MKHLITLLLLVVAFTPTASSQDMSGHDAEDFMGRWGLFLPGGAGWLNVHKDNGYLDAELLWRGGSVLPVANIYIAGDKLIVTRVNSMEKENGRSMTRTQRIVLEPGVGQLVGKSYMPMANGMGEQVIPIKAMRLPDLPPAPNVAKAKMGESIKLFNGNDLTGWSLINSNHKNGWKVEDGVLINDPVQPEGDDHHYRYGNLRTDATFEDFNLKLEVNIPKGSNSGVYLRGIYEIQVVDSYGKKLDPHNMGALYSRVKPAMAAEKEGGEWQSMDITLYNHHVTVVLNGKKILDNAPVQGVTGGAMTADEFSPGPIYLQGDHGRVLYRNMVLTPILD
ncbi:MAG: DUF1080 domain-containing protein [Rhodothermaceae bacterium]|nr:DUF1080 domain-containing protein [Rhodothermaceae bacterium]